MAAISISKKPIHHDRTRHVLNQHFIKEKIEYEILDLIYTPSRFPIAEVLTKTLSKTRFEEFESKLGMIYIYS